MIFLTYCPHYMKFNPSKFDGVCNEHFTEQDYEEADFRQFQLNLISQGKLRLKINSVSRTQSVTGVTSKIVTVNVSIYQNKFMHCPF